MKLKKIFFVTISPCVIFLTSAFSYASDINFILNEFKSKSTLWKSFELEQASLEAEIKSRDLTVAPQLSLSWNELKDRRQSTSLQIRDYEQILSAQLSKYFFTGTTLSLNATANDYSFRTQPGSKIYTTEWEVSLRQNLWQDFFGEKDSLRRSINLSDLKLKKLQLDLQMNQLLIQVEDTYWDYLTAHLETKLRTENLKKWKDIEIWIKNRFNRSAAELVDVKQITATRILREIQLQTSEQRKQTIETQFVQYLSNEALSSIKIDKNLFLKTNIPSTPNQMNSLESLIAIEQSEISRLNSKLTNEDQKPNLSFSVGYGKRGIEDSGTKAIENSQSTSRDYTRVGFLFSTPIDFSLKDEKRKSAILKSQSDENRKNHFINASKSSFTDLNNQIKILSSRVELLELLFSEQKLRNQSERSRFLNGRSTSLQLVTAEQDLLDAEVTLYSQAAQLNKTISRLKLYK